MEACAPPRLRAGLAHSDEAVEMDLLEGHAVAHHEQFLHGLDHGRRAGEVEVELIQRPGQGAFDLGMHEARRPLPAAGLDSTTVVVTRSGASAAASCAAPSSACVRSPRKKCTRRVPPPASTPRATDSIGPRPEPPATHTTSRSVGRNQAWPNGPSTSRRSPTWSCSHRTPLPRPSGTRRTMKRQSPSAPSTWDIE